MRLRLLALPLAFALLATAAAAQCLDAGSIDRGVVFKRQNGDEGFALRKGRAVYVDYVTNRVSVQDERVAAYGIYETAWDYYPYGPDLVGAGTVSTETSFASKGPEPTQRPVFRTSWRARIVDHAPVEGGPIVSRKTGKVGFQFETPDVAKLSGCTYNIIRVVATFEDEDGWRTQRWVYFTDLGFGLETRVTTASEDRKLGLVALRAPK